MTKEQYKKNYPNLYQNYYFYNLKFCVNIYNKILKNSKFMKKFLKVLKII